MNHKISQTVQKSQHNTLPGVQMLRHLLPSQIIRDVLENTNCYEQRQRKLRAEWVVWICIIMAWLPRYSIQAVMAKLWQVASINQLHPTATMASASAISQARYRLGVKALEQVFKRVCQPMATSATTGAFYQGKRLVAVDGTREDVADTAANARYFGYAGGQYGRSAFPQLRAVYVCELGTHLIFDAMVGHAHRSEPAMACRLLRSIDTDMLVMVDAGLSSYDFISGALNRGADVLVRASEARRWHPVQYLADGSFLAWLSSSDKSQNPHADPILVRVIRYTLQDETRPHHGKVRTLITTLLDPVSYPARDLIVLYHERWEVEIAIDEIDTHQRLAHRPFRSLKPVGVLQEFYALLIAYFLVRLVMLQTAEAHNLDPDRLSFTSTIHLLVDTLPVFQLMPAAAYERLWHWLRRWIIYFQLPPRRNRSNPRVVRRQQVKFARKRDKHRTHRQPSKPFRDAIVLLT